MSQIINEEFLEQLVSENEKIVVITEDVISHLKDGRRIKIKGNRGENIHLTIKENEFQNI